VEARRLAGPSRPANFIVKPGADELVGALLPLYVRNMVFRALVETAASEHGARRTAMKNATDNAGEMLDLLRRTYNRARQGQITQELAEIVGGAPGRGSSMGLVLPPSSREVYCLTTPAEGRVRAEGARRDGRRSRT